MSIEMRIESTPVYILGADMMPVRKYETRAKRWEGTHFERYEVVRASRLEALDKLFEQMECRHIFHLINYAEKKCMQCGHRTDDRH